MSRRPPANTPHWQQLVRVFKEIAPSRWLKTAREWSAVERRDLRRCFDRKLTPDEMKQVDQFLMDSLEQHIRDLEKRRETAENMIREIMRAGNECSVGCEIETPVDMSDVPDRPFDPSSLQPWEGIILEMMEDA